MDKRTTGIIATIASAYYADARDFSCVFSGQRRRLAEER
jgi:hypothetical protein